jgi:hypothetical protein
MGGASGVFLCLAVIYFVFLGASGVGLRTDRGEKRRSDAFGERIAVSGGNLIVEIVGCWIGANNECGACVTAGGFLYVSKLTMQLRPSTAQATRWAPGWR